MKPYLNKSTTRPLAAISLALASVSALCGQDAAKPAAAPAAAAPPAPEKTGVDKFFTEDLFGALKNGKFDLNVRYRYEYADQVNLEPSNANTIRTRFGYTTAPLYGFQAMVQGENNTAIGNPNNYNNTIGDGAGKTPIPDPPSTEINQYWLSYNNWDTLLKGPRQVIIMDNHRFIGNVGFRQNEQTFDAVYLRNDSIKDVALQYAYLYQINRIFGSESPQGTWQSQSQLFNGQWNIKPYARVTAYTYLLDFVESSPVNSTASYGAFAVGDVPINDQLALDYRAEFAWQSDYASSPLDYSAPYYHVALNGKIAKRYSLEVGYEVLGSDNNVGFKTPLATLHAFNGWADTFLATPAQGLRDLYVRFGVNLPYQIPFEVIYHTYNSDKMDLDFGQEIDVGISKKFYKFFTASLQYAWYDGDGGYQDSQKVWASLEFKY